MDETPRTDALNTAFLHQHNAYCAGHSSVDVDDQNAYMKMRDLACQLERELLAVTAERDQLQKQIEHLRSGSNSSPDRAPEDRGYLRIDHGSVSLGCNPETIQRFVDRMIAAKIRLECK